MKTELKTQQHYQLAVIGSGSGGRAAVLFAARKGLSTTLVEGDKIGGACFRTGATLSVPSKPVRTNFVMLCAADALTTKVDLLKVSLYDWMIVL
jgi:pyruvate/2-oxoglutarate dehydrogenase complex dihydrolipoamide dehydrogenase (E3) component